MKRWRKNRVVQCRWSRVRGLSLRTREKVRSEKIRDSGKRQRPVVTVSPYLLNRLILDYGLVSPELSKMLFGSPVVLLQEIGSKKVKGKDDNLDNLNRTEVFLYQQETLCTI